MLSHNPYFSTEVKEMSKQMEVSAVMYLAAHLVQHIFLEETAHLKFTTRQSCSSHLNTIYIFCIEILRLTAQSYGAISTGAAVPRQLPLQPMGTMAATGGTLGEADACPLPLGAGPAMGLLENICVRPSNPAWTIRSNIETKPALPLF